MAKNKLLDEVVGLIGMPSAIILTRRYGGKALSVPSLQNLHEKHPIALTIGWEPARKLCQMFGSEMINLPIEVNALLGIRNTEIVRLFVEEGQSIRCLSIAFGIDRGMIARLIDKAGHRDLRISRSETLAKEKE